MIFFSFSFHAMTMLLLLFNCRMKEKLAKETFIIKLFIFFYFFRISYGSVPSFLFKWLTKAESKMKKKIHGKSLLKTKYYNDE